MPIEPRTSDTSEQTNEQTTRFFRTLKIRTFVSKWGENPVFAVRMYRVIPLCGGL